MKRIYRLFAACSVFLAAGVLFPLSAEEKKAEMYYVNAPIVKIFPHGKGYYVIYRRAGLETSEVFIPMSWFDARNSKADITYINTRINPYVSFFMRNGAFEYVRISAPKDLKADVWGTLPYPQQYNEKFEGVETLSPAF